MNVLENVLAEYALENAVVESVLGKNVLENILDFEGDWPLPDAFPA